MQSFRFLKWHYLMIVGGIIFGLHMHAENIAMEIIPYDDQQILLNNEMPENELLLKSCDKAPVFGGL